MSEKHLPYIGGNFDRIVFEGDGSTWVREQSGTRYLKLFGTPERAARTMALMCECSPECSFCLLQGRAENICKGGDYDALLEWLKGRNE